MRANKFRWFTTCFIAVTLRVRQLAPHVTPLSNSAVSNTHGHPSNGATTGPTTGYTTGRGGDNIVYDQQDATCWGSYDGVGHINTRGLHDGTCDEAIARPVTGHTRRVHDGSSDWTTWPVAHPSSAMLVAVVLSQMRNLIIRSVVDSSYVARHKSRNGFVAGAII